MLFVSHGGKRHASLGGRKHLLTQRRAQHDALQCGMSSNPTDLIKQAIVLEKVKMFFPI